MKDIHPVSLRLDAATLRQTTALAKRRKVGVTTALRMLINERLEEIRAEDELGAALRWQQKETLVTLERWENGEAAEMSLEQLRDVHQKALRAKRRK